MLDFSNILTEHGQTILYFYTIPFFAVVIFAEMLFSYFGNRQLYKGKDLAMNVFLALINFGLDLVMKTFAMLVMFFFFKHRIFDFDLNVWYFIACFVVTDFAYFVHHYVDHHSRFFWAVHITHHNSEHFNITTGFRSPVLQPLYRYLFFSPLALLGFNPWHVMVMYSLGQIYGTLVHTQTVKKMGFLEYFMVTPSHHRVHHACNIKYLDRNMGMVFIIWDRIFGTFEAEDPKVPVKYGIYPKMPDNGAVTTIFYEWRKIWKDLKQPKLKLTDRINYLFNSPGWRHDGTGKTVRNFQKEYWAKKRKSAKKKVA